MKQLLAAMHRSKQKNAQQGHGAIVPVDPKQIPGGVYSGVKGAKEGLRSTLLGLTEQQRRLYELIWRRTLACQMAQARLQQVHRSFTIASPLVCCCRAFSCLHGCIMTILITACMTSSSRFIPSQQHLTRSHNNSHGSRHAVVNWHPWPA